MIIVNHSFDTKELKKQEKNRFVQFANCFTVLWSRHTNRFYMQNPRGQEMSKHNVCFEFLAVHSNNTYYIYTCLSYTFDRKSNGSFCFCGTKFCKISTVLLLSSAAWWSSYCRFSIKGSKEIRYKKGFKHSITELAMRIGVILSYTWHDKHWF